MNSPDYRSYVPPLLLIASILLGACASPDRTGQQESTSNLIYTYDQWAQESEEVGNQEFANHYREKADQERDRFDRQSSGLFELFVEVIFVALFDTDDE